MNGYDISEISKAITETKNKDGFEAAVKLVDSTIDQYHLEFDDLSHLLKRQIPYILKLKREGFDLTKYVESRISEYSECHTPNGICRIADVLNKISRGEAILYLEGKLGIVGSTSKDEPEMFKPLLNLAEYYIANKNGDKAFQTTNRLGYLLPFETVNTFQINNQLQVTNLKVEACFSGYEKPVYFHFLYYEILYFLLDLSYWLAQFYWHDVFFHMKRECYEDGYSRFNLPRFDEGLEAMNIANLRESLLKDVYGFAFHELPLTFGIEKRFLDETIYNKYKEASTDTEHQLSSEAWDLSNRLFERKFNLMPLVDGVEGIIGEYIS